MKTIIYATDCTINDAFSLRYAYRFSCIMNADLHILHVYQFPPIAFSTIKSSEALRKRFQQEQKELAAQYCATHLKNEFRQKPITIHALENVSIAKSILNLTKELCSDLIIIGMKDSYTTRGYLSGNIADALLDKIEVPLLMVPNGVDYNMLSTILYATDFEEEDLISIQKLIEIARPFNALIEIVHVFETIEYTAKEQMERLKKELLKQVLYPEITFKTIASGKVKSGLLSVLRNENVNMLAMLERKHNWELNNLFHKDLVKEMEATVAIPVLAFNKRSTKLQNENALNINKVMVLFFSLLLPF